MKNFDYEPLVVFSLSEKASECPPAAALLAQGCYKGECEPAFIMAAAAFYGSIWPDILREDDQECLLYLDNQRSGWLRYGPVYDESDQRYLGRWREVSAQFASKLYAYTIYNGRYFAVA